MAAVAERRLPLLDVFFALRQSRHAAPGDGLIARRVAAGRIGRRARPVAALVARLAARGRMVEPIAPIHFATAQLLAAAAAATAEDAALAQPRAMVARTTGAGLVAIVARTAVAASIAAAADVAAGHSTQDHQ